MDDRTAAKKAAATLGRLGGLARSRKYTKEERSALARLSNARRWAGATPEQRKRNTAKARAAWRAKAKRRKEKGL